MTRMMIGPVLLLAAMVSPVSGDSPASGRAPSFQPVGGATARATVRIRIVSAARFGQGYSAEAVGAAHRAASLADDTGQQRPALLLEFQ